MDRIHIFIGEKITSSQGHFQMCNHYQPSKLPHSIAEIGWASEARKETAIEKDARVICWDEDFFEKVNFRYC